MFQSCQRSYWEVVVIDHGHNKKNAIKGLEWEPYEKAGVVGTIDFAKILLCGKSGSIGGFGVHKVIESCMEGKI